MHIFLDVLIKDIVERYADSQGFSMILGLLLVRKIWQIGSYNSKVLTTAYEGTYLRD